MRISYIMFCPEYKSKRGYLEVSVGTNVIYCITIYRDIRKTAYFGIKTRNGELQQEAEGTVFNAEDKTDEEVMEFIIYNNRFYSVHKSSILRGPMIQHGTISA